MPTVGKNKGTIATQVLNLYPPDHDEVGLVASTVTGTRLALPDARSTKP